MLEEHLKKVTNSHISDICVLAQNKRPLVLFGAGATGTAILESCISNGISVECFCDNNPAKHGTKHAGLSVISYELLKKRYSDCNLIITIGTPDVKDVKVMLNRDGFNNIFPFDMLLFNFSHGRDYIFENLANFEKLYAELEDDFSRRVLIARLNYIIGSDKAELESVQTQNEYFDTSVFRFSKDEYFIDAGSLDGQTALEFAGVVQDYKKIICFEPDSGNYKKTINSIASLPRTVVYPLGLWSGKTTLKFQSKGGASCISDAGDINIEVDAIDRLLPGEPITFIKMDIEGAEAEAITGASNTIRTREPKLAICVYHRQEDILSIPFQIKELVPEYKIYLRHHSPSLLDTVCYVTI